MNARRQLCWSFAIAAMCAANLHAQTLPDDPPVKKLGAGAITAQITTGVLGTAVGFVAGGLTARWAAHRLGANDDQASNVAPVGAYTGAALLTAVGPALIGSRDGAHGSYPAAVGGAVVGGAVARVVKWVGDRGVFGESGPVAIFAGVVIAFLPSVGATIAFNSTR